MFYKVKGISKKTGLGTVYCVLRTKTGDRVSETVKTTGVTVNPAHFNTKTGKVSQRDTLYIEKNERIHTVGAGMEAVARDLDWSGIVPTKQTVERGIQQNAELPAVFDAVRAARIRIHEDQRATLLLDIQELEAQLSAKRTTLEKLEIGLGIRAKPLQLSKLIDQYKAMKAAQDVKPGTLKNFTVLNNIVARYDSQALLTDMGLDWFNAFQTHLVKRGVTNKSILEVMGKLKTVFRHYANKHNISTGFLADFVPVKDGAANDVLFLTADQLAELEALDIPAANVGQIDVRRQFLFAVETGLRRSDYQVSESNIKGDELVVITTKTGKVASIPFTQKARQLFADANHNFRLIKETQFNQTLRIICKKLASMQDDVTNYSYVGGATKEETLPRWQWMTSHVARKTYAHNALSRGASATAVAEWLAHKSTAMLDKHYSNRKELARQEAYKVL
ncbi:tyrosine-type recombinase/integrase [Hymenobacter monticola]|uniref:Tyrosine-type recombinase/integrase n=1 Tax=Hymenobacter monticola TaxID=1705399 RepID=A0ABY4B4Z8_9BACT|nr:tyrosine-type recombinase/integrase [Hymenobacter monticola]UOE34212.1 tyrosine-type recombinase/integrase [Hymenobacter monticola]